MFLFCVINVSHFRCERFKHMWQTMSNLKDHLYNAFYILSASRITSIYLTLHNVLVGLLFEQCTTNIYIHIYIYVYIYIYSYNYITACKTAKKMSCVSHRWSDGLARPIADEWMMVESVCVWITAIMTIETWMIDIGSVYYYGQLIYLTVFVPLGS